MPDLTAPDPVQAPPAPPARTSRTAERTVTR